jgi:hypothetical protein
MYGGKKLQAPVTGERDAPERVLQSTVRVPRCRHPVQSRPRRFTAGERNSRQGGDLTMLVILKNLSGSNLTFGGNC